MQTITYQAIKINQNTQMSTQDVLVLEAPLQININNKAYTVVMRTPDDDKDLVLGLLYAEDIYKNTDPVGFEVIEENNTVLFTQDTVYIEE